MEKIAKKLTDYVIKKEIIDEADRKVYEYGFMIMMEIGLFALFSLFICLYLHMVVEGMLFFLIFAPLRSYAGGLHLDRFSSCFILSCLTFSGILLTVESIHLSNMTAVIILIILQIFIYVLYPVENINRKVDKEENRYFKKRLYQYLGGHFLISGICVALKCDKYLLVIIVTYAMVVITMIIGKYKNMKRAGN